jgi:hypothetical protein
MHNAQQQQEELRRKIWEDEELKVMVEKSCFRKMAGKMGMTFEKSGSRVSFFGSACAICNFSVYHHDE